MSDFPTFALEVDFTNTDTWVDISDRFVSATISRGKQRELDTNAAGTMTVVLRNDDRELDPSFEDSAFWPDVKPMRRIRLVATRAAVERHLFNGYVDRWKPNPGGPNDATITVDATDYFKVLAATMLPSSPYAAEVLADSPTAWWRLSEPDDQTTAFDAAGDMDLAYADNPNRAEQSLIAREPNGSVFFSHTDPNRVQGQVQPITAYPFTIEAVIRSNETRDDYERFIFRQRRTDVDGMLLRVSTTANSAAGKLLWGHTNDNVVGQVWRSTSRVDDGSPHHVALVATSASSVLIYVDGVAGQTHVTNTATPTIAASGWITSLGNISAEAFNVGLFGFDGWLQDIAVYPVALAQARVEAHAAALTLPWDGDTPGERADKVAAIADRTWFGETNLLAPATSFDTGASVMQSAVLGETALEHLQGVAQAEFGELFVQADGTLRLVGRLGLINQPAGSEVSDAHGTDPAVIAYQPEFGDDLIRNHVAVSRREGVVHTAQDATSIDDYLTHSFTLDGLYHDSDELSRYAAQFLVSEYAQPLLRVSGVTLRPRSDPSVLFPIVMTRDLGDTIDISITPQGVGDPFTQHSVIQRVEHTIGPLAWETRWTISPALAGCFLELDTGECGLDEGRIYF